MMNASIKQVRAFMRFDRGDSSIEYAVLLSAIVVSAILGVALLGRTVRESSITAAAGAGRQGVTDGSGGSGGGGNSGGDGNNNGGGGGSPYTKVVFSDTFDDAKWSKPRWDFSDSSWNVANGNLNGGPVAGSNDIVAFAKSSQFDDGTILLDANLQGNSGAGYSVFFHLSGDPNNQKKFDGYAFSYDPSYGKGAFVLRKWVDGVEIWQPLAIYAPSNSYAWYGATHIIEIGTNGSLITAKVDGHSVLSVTDQSFGKGGVALRAFNHPIVSFGSLLVTTREGKP
jgi:Flp pilus assembly pilin Flp